MSTQGVGKIRKGVSPLVAFGLFVALASFAFPTLMTYLNIRALNEDTRIVGHTHDVLNAMERLLSSLKDAETGQRGYLLTGENSYLAPYRGAVAELPVLVGEVGRLTAGDADEQRQLEVIERHASAKLEELNQTVELRRLSGLDAALAVLRTDRGKGEMDALRKGLGELSTIETAKRQEGLSNAQRAYTTAVVGELASGALGVLLTLALGVLLLRAAAQQSLQNWLQAGRADLATAALGDPRPEELARKLLGFFADYLGVRVAALYFRDGRDFVRTASAGAPPEADVVMRFTPGETLLGQAAAGGRAIVLDDVSQTHLAFATALGTSPPRHIVIAPAGTQGGVDAVVELGFLARPGAAVLQLLDAVGETIGVAVRASGFREQLQKLLAQTQRQAEELGAQGEELRVSNEELEAQSRALRHSQTGLETSQAELEQINAALESQRDDLAAATQAAAARAREADQASRYKSQFLANMSHELRTPLNSLLILAKLLADNSNANLSDEQVRFARTIYDSGNDLLTLINDILDLSKVEAGQTDFRPETFALAEFGEAMRRNFDPVAKNRGLGFEVTLSPHAPERIATDRRRLDQIVKNLLANALKFTQSGSVTLRIEPAGEAGIAFGVVDTGIGVAKDQQARIFEPFQQADGTISRKFGGAGLGLSISRELARLIGGDLTLASEPGQGSTFTLTIPALTSSSAPHVWAAPQTAPPSPREAGAVAPKASPFPPREGTPSAHGRAGKRLLLVVEDDPVFAGILEDFAHETGFEVLLAGTAQAAHRLAFEHRPSAILLDLGLPDRSGLTVLHELKRDVRTRHIPIHVVSASENAETALALGAVGYLLKPVRREDILDALAKLERRLENPLRRVLIVEDDAVQRDAVSRLLSADDVVIETAVNAQECLHKLKGATFDCMVLDLALPDASGYALLETLSREDAYSFPPVIVYTGRELSAHEEQQLRRYSHSIIIKGAKSPERLLDEVTLFLHQVVEGLSEEQQTLLRRAQNRDDTLEGKRVLVVEDDVRNIYALSSVLEPRGVKVQIARNGREAVEAMAKSVGGAAPAIDLVLMDVMMPEMDGLTATREIRKDARLKKLPILMLTAKAMPDDQEKCLEAGASDYMAKPLDVDRLLSLVRVWMPR